MNGGERRGGASPASVTMARCDKTQRQFRSMDTRERTVEAGCEEEFRTNKG